MTQNHTCPHCGAEFDNRAGLNFCLAHHECDAAEWLAWQEAAQEASYKQDVLAAQNAMRAAKTAYDLKLTELYERNNRRLRDINDQAARMHERAERRKEQNKDREETI